MIAHHPLEGMVNIHYFRTEKSKMARPQSVLILSKFQRVKRVHGTL